MSIAFCLPATEGQHARNPERPGRLAGRRETAPSRPLDVACPVIMATSPHAKKEGAMGAVVFKQSSPLSVTVGDSKAVGGPYSDGARELGGQSRDNPAQSVTGRSYTEMPVQALRRNGPGASLADGPTASCAPRRAAFANEVPATGSRPAGDCKPLATGAAQRRSESTPRRELSGLPLRNPSAADLKSIPSKETR
jgi:hypothetical protein